MELRGYQSEVISKALNHLKESDRCCISLATGAGKTFVFSNLCKELTGNVLVLVNRQELAEQTQEAFKDVGIETALVTSKKKQLLNNGVTVAMTKTFYNAMKKGFALLDFYDYLIVDECHIQEFAPIVTKAACKIIGFTATPQITNSHIETDGINRFKCKTPLAEHYDTLIEGVDIKYLIDNGFLVEDIVFEDVKNKDLEALKEDATGEFTNASQEQVFNNPKAYSDFLQIYEKHAQGLKTIVFNSNTLINKKAFEIFKTKGYPVRIYDSKNASVKDRIEVVEWFRKTEGAILMNVNVFTTGFDVKEVECIILNNATASLNKYIQMVGRGSRITDKIYKPSFKVLDLGGNTQRFGRWSARRDWRKMFYDNSRKKLGNPKPAPIRECGACGNLIAANSITCPNCGEEKKVDSTANGGVVAHEQPKKPSAEKIIVFCETHGFDVNQARKYVIVGIVELMTSYSFESYTAHKESGVLFDKLKALWVKDYYFKLQGSKLEGNRLVKLDRCVNKTIEKIDNYYESIRG